MKSFFLLLSIVLISIKASAQTPITDVESTPLFNGKDLSGWTIYGTEKWYVDNDLLTCVNGPDEEFGYLGTDKNYKNFELNLEFKQGANNSNGGVFVHSTIEGTKIQGWQVEIGAPGHFTGGIHAYDRGWLIKPELEKDKALKIGEWNHLKILLKDDKMVVWLNGTEMVSLTDPKLATAEGLIAFQIHKGDYTKIEWRNINITEL